MRKDFNQFFADLVPENESLYTHIEEGIDDMPAHIKSSILGHSILIPIVNNKLGLGTWQGIYLGEHRENHKSCRKIIATIIS